MQAISPDCVHKAFYSWCFEAWKLEISQVKDSRATRRACATICKAGRKARVLSITRKISTSNFCSINTAIYLSCTQLHKSQVQLVYLLKHEICSISAIADSNTATMEERNLDFSCRDHLGFDTRITQTAGDVDARPCRCCNSNLRTAEPQLLSQHHKYHSGTSK